MKRGVVTVMMICCGMQAWAQTVGEIFNQKKTQRKYLLEAIAQLQLYGGYAAKGYRVVQKGMQTVSDVKKGDLNLHRAFMERSGVVSPAIKNSAKTAAIILIQLQLVRQIKAIRNNYTGIHKDYVRAVTDRAAACSNEMLNALMGIVSEQKMNDAQRLERIDQLYEEAKKQQAFVQSFGADVLQMKKQQ